MAGCKAQRARLHDHADSCLRGLQQPRGRSPRDTRAVSHAGPPPPPGCAGRSPSPFRGGVVMRRLLLPLAMLLAVAAPAQAGQAPERRAVLATVQRFFDALAARDQGALMATVIPEGRITSHRVRDGRTVVQTGGWSEW